MYPRNRIGRFKISTKLIESDDAIRIIPLIFENMVIIEATMHYWDNMIHYVSICNDFEEVEEGAEPNEYIVNIYPKDTENDSDFERIKDDYKVTFTKKHDRKYNRRFERLGI